MTCWLTGHDDRFKAARRRRRRQRPGQHVRRLRRRRLHGPLRARRPAVGAARSGTPRCRRSPRSTRSRTPTLILHGEDDLTCPVGQAQQWHTSLRERGVPTELVALPGRLARVHPARPALAAARLQPPGRRLGRAVRRPRRPPARSTVAHWQRRLDGAGRSGTTCPAPSSASCGSTGRRRRAGRRGVRRAQHAHRRAASPTDSLFQIGSITKVWTATVVMQLVDEGLLDLDAPIVEVLPELRLADPDVTKQRDACGTCSPTPAASTATSSPTPAAATTASRSTSTLLADAAQNHPLGATWSYCNSGFSLLGRVIEKLTGKTWDAGHARAAVHAARPDPHGHAARGGAAATRAAVGHVERRRRAGRRARSGSCPARSARPG